MGRSPCCAKEGLNRGAWTAMEDKILTAYIKTHGEGKWRNLPKRAGLKRCGKSCRLRWLNYLRPDIKRGNITDDEEELIIRLHKLLGNRWSLIAGRLPGRTDNEIKNYWNTNLSKRIDNDAAVAKRFNHTRSTPNTTIKKKKKSSSTIPTNSKNKTTTLLPPSTTLPVKRPSSSSSLTDSPKVVRTKAVRCTKVYLVDPLPPPLPRVSSVGDAPLKTEVAVPASNCNNKMVPPVAAAASTVNQLDVLLPSSSPLPCDYHRSHNDDDLYWVSDGMKVPLTTAGSSSDLTSTVAEGDASGLGDMSLDFNFLDLLDSNTYLSDISFDFESGNLSSGDNTHHHNNNNHSPISSSEEEGEEQPIVFSEEMMEDWRRSDCATAAAFCFDANAIL